MVARGVGAGHGFPLNTCLPLACLKFKKAALSSLAPRCARPSHCPDEESKSISIRYSCAASSGTQRSSPIAPRRKGAAPDGHKVSGQYTVLRVLRRQDGVWKAFAAEMTPLRASTAAKPMIETGAAASANAELSSSEQQLVDVDRKWVEAIAKGDAQISEAAIRRPHVPGPAGRTRG